MRLKSLSAVAILIACGAVARADTTYYNFTLTGTGISSSGQIGLTSTSNSNIFDVTSVNGTFTSVALGATNQTITGLYPGASYSSSNPSETPAGTYVFDDLIYPSGATVTCGLMTTTGAADNCGVLFSLANGSVVNVFGIDGAGNLVLSDSPSASTFTLGDDHAPITFTYSPAAVTPEPSSLFLVGTGLVGAAGTLRRRFASRRSA